MLSDHWGCSQYLFPISFRLDQQALITNGFLSNNSSVHTRMECPGASRVSDRQPKGWGFITESGTASIPGTPHPRQRG